MLQGQEIIERSIYHSLLNVTIALGYTVDPELYQPPTPEVENLFKTDVENIVLDKTFFVNVFGSSNSQSKGEKVVPRIVVQPRGYLPGDIGLPKELIEKQETNYMVSELPYEAIDQFIDIHLVANTQKSIRVLQQILQLAIPERGYLKPYTYDNPPFDGNIYIQAVNFYDKPDTDKGIIEKIYQYEVKDTLLAVREDVGELPMIIDIAVLLNNNQNLWEDYIHITKQ